MQVQFNPLSSVKIEGKVLLSADEVNPFIDRALSKYEKSVRLDGFRKGHIPKVTLLQFYGSQIGTEAAEEITRKYAGDVVDQVGQQKGVDLIALRTPEYKFSTQYPSRNKEWSFSIVFDTYPSIEKQDLSDLHVDVYDVKVDEADLEDTINRLREMRAKLEVIDDLVVAKGEMQFANINFVGKVDGVPFEGGSAEKFDLDIDRANMIDGFVEGIIGHKAGDEFTINVVFPDDYKVESLRSANATFDIKVNTVSKRVVPEFNEDLAKSYGFDPEKGDLEAFKNTLWHTIKSQANQSKVEFNTTIMLDAILAKYPEVEAPEVLIEAEAARFVDSYVKSYGLKEVSEESKKKFAAQYYETFRPVVLRQCMSRALVKAYGLVDSLTVSQEETDAELETAAFVYEDGYVDPEKFKEDAKNDQDTMNYCHNLVYARKFEQALMNLLNHDVKEIGLDDFNKVIHEKDAADQRAISEKYAAQHAAAQASESAPAPESAPASESAPEPANAN